MLPGFAFDFEFPEESRVNCIASGLGLGFAPPHHFAAIFEFTDRARADSHVVMFSRFTQVV